MHEKLSEFATRYAAAWSSQNAASLAAFYAENGSLTINGGTPSVGRAAIAATAQGFMTAFPDMVVKMDGMSQDGRSRVPAPIEVRGAASALTRTASRHHMVRRRSPDKSRVTLDGD